VLGGFAPPRRWDHPRVTLALLFVLTIAAVAAAALAVAYALSHS
jgi:hypothetical protein